MILLGMLAVGGVIGWIIYEICHAPVIDDKPKTVKSKKQTKSTKQKSQMKKKTPAKKTKQKKVSKSSRH